MKNHIKDSNKKLAIIGGENHSDSVKKKKEMSISTEVYIWLQMVDCVHVFLSCPPLRPYNKKFISSMKMLKEKQHFTNKRDILVYHFWKNKEGCELKD